MSPEAMLRICPGYASSAVCGPVARAGALRRPREKSAEWQNFPEAMLRICPGYRTKRSARRDQRNHRTLLLALAAIKRRPLCMLAADNRRPANAARLALAAINL